MSKGKARQASSYHFRSSFHRTLHTTSAALNAASTPFKRSPNIASSSSSTLLPPPTSSTYPPSSFAGLGTTQLSPDIMLRCTIFDSTGSATSTSGVFKKSRLCSDHGLEPRDLRKIDSRVPNLVPTILARRGGILVNILHIRAMIKKDKVLLFDSYGSTDSQLHSAFVYNLQHNLRSTNSHGGGGGGSGLAYEFRALESILVSVLDALRIELGVVRGWTSRVLEELDDDVDREKLRTLLQVSRKLNAFLSRGRAVKGAVTEVLENEEDMALMYLSDNPTPPTTGNSTPANTPSPTSTTSSTTSSTTTTTTTITPSSSSSEATDTAMDELELLLESFDKQVEEVVAETTQLHSDITNTQEVVELILDNNRNKLLALDLKTSIATMGISVGTLWAGLFGMNLKSHMEEMDWAFAVVSGVAMGAVCLTAGVGLRRLERLRRVGLGMGKRAGERRKGWWWGGRGKKVDGGVGMYPQNGVGLMAGGGGGGGGGVPMGYVAAYQTYQPLWSGDAVPPPAHGVDHQQQQAPPSWPNPASPTPTQPPPNSHFDSHNTTTTPHPAGRGMGTAGLGLGLGSKWDPASSSKINNNNNNPPGTAAVAGGLGKKRRKS